MWGYSIAELDDAVTNQTLESCRLGDGCESVKIDPYITLTNYFSVSQSHDITMAPKGEADYF